ncbi:MAG: peptidoglycan D,D-transpeptidase FtsI family protein [Candidatus Scatovivens sp.]
MSNIKKSKKEARKVMNFKIRVFGIGMTILFIIVAISLGIIIFIHGEEYSQSAYKNQTKNQIISPKRGIIYDCNGEILAMSVSVDTVSINPDNVKYSNDKKVEPEVLAKKFSDLFDSLTYEEALEKVNSNSSVVIIARKVENEKITELKNWMKENKITTGINIDEDSKRNYPNNDLASNLLGFCGTDNTGIIGIEERWNDILTGTAGKIVATKDNNGEIISDEAEQYVKEENGRNLYLTIDTNIQAITERCLEEACVSNNSLRGGNVIIMNPQNGDILSMATYPDYNLNDPFNIEATGLQDVWDGLSKEEKNSAYTSLWANRAVSSTYEPGSTFKLLVAAAGLEENLVETDTDGEFVCTGSYVVADRTISCWRKEPHGHQSLRLALQNSCNPAFMQLGQRIGVSLLYKYFEAFGLFDRTGDDIAKTYNGVFFEESKIAAPELATMSFGQRIEISPLQLITAVSAIANDGVLVKPRIVSKIENPDTKSVETVDVEEIRQVISKETAGKVKDMMRSVVKDGTGKTAAVNGYEIGGKSGTSEPRENYEEEGYVASFIAISPIENTQVVVLVTIYGVHGQVHQGGQVAGPVAKNILTEILPYLGVTGEN